jgi:non-specific serine/threonine protein kinase/serine/threonine-protein kinase
VLGDDHPATLLSINGMGLLLHSMGKLSEAEPYHREALEGFRRVLGDDHPATLASITSMGLLLYSMGKLGEAEALSADAVAGARRSLPEGDWSTGAFLRHHGLYLTELERYADAETALLEAHGILEAALGAQHKQTILVIQSLTDLYAAWHEAEPNQGHDAQAATWRAKLEQWQATTRPVATQPAASQLTSSDGSHGVAVREGVAASTVEQRRQHQVPEGRQR